MTPPTQQPQASNDRSFLEIRRPKCPKSRLEWQTILIIFLLLVLQSFSCYSNAFNLVLIIVTICLVGLILLFGVYNVLIQSEQSLIIFLVISPITEVWTLVLTIWMLVLVTEHYSDFYHSPFHIVAISLGFLTIPIYLLLIYSTMRVRKFWINQRIFQSNKGGLNTIPFRLENHGDFSAYRNNLSPPEVPPPSEIIITPSAPLSPFPESIPVDLNHLPPIEINETPILSIPTPTAPGQLTLYPSLADIQASPLHLFQNIPSYLYDQVPSAPFEDDHK